MTTMLLDSASLYYRAFYGVPATMTAPDGTANNAVRGFLDMIARLIDTHSPNGFVACLDNDWRPAFRTDAIPSYKLHRLADETANAEDTPEDLVPQVPAILQVIDALGICSVGVDGTEADDVIGTIAATGGPYDVVTGDRDLFQVIDDARGVRVLYTARGLGNLEVMNDAALMAKYGVLPSQYVDFAILRGDPSDGLPGVRGIGEKTAAALLNHYANLDEMRSAAAAGEPGPIKPAQRSNLNAASDYLDVARTVVAVRRDLQIDVDPALPTEVADPELLDDLVAQWGIASSIERVNAALARAASASAS
ncbi:MAG: 5'-3' exonuclease H3TH domain-containing protein [Cumulibacter sp.]